MLANRCTLHSMWSSIGEGSCWAGSCSRWARVR